MKTQFRTIVVTAMATAALTLGIQSIATEGPTEGQATHVKTVKASEKKMETGAKLIHEIMLRSAKKTVEGKMPMEGDTDKMFGVTMAGHHQSGIDMAKVELEHGTDPKMKALARKILQAQQKEKTQLLEAASKAK